MALKLVKHPTTNCVVEFMQGNAPQIAWVLEEQSGKLRLLLPNRRETPLPANRLLPWSGPLYSGNYTKDDVVKILYSHKETREKKSAALDPYSLWELAEGEVEKAEATWLCELAIDDADVDDIAAVGHALLETKTHFKFQPPEFEIFTREVVETRKAQEEAQRQKEALVDGGAAWLCMLWDRYKAKKPPLAGLGDAPQGMEAPEQDVQKRLAHILLARVLRPESQEDEGLWKQVSKGLPVSTLEENLLPLFLAESWGLIPPHYNFWMARAGYEEGDSWSQAYLPQIQSVIEATLQTNLPLCSLPFVSVDNATTRDIDDAFFVEQTPDGGWLAHLALACPALCWPFEEKNLMSPPGKSLDSAVFSRATSLYLPEGTSHMMPEILGTAACSLLQKEKRPALVLHICVTPTGEIQSFTAEAAWVCVAQNSTYTEVEKILDSTLLSAPSFPEPTPAIDPAPLFAASAMAKVRLNRRVADGAVIMERPDVDFILETDSQGAVTLRLLEEEPAPNAHLMVSEMMVLASAALADWAVTHHIPLLFRTQSSVTKENAGIWTDPVDIARIARGMSPALMEVEAKPHASMGLTAYSPVTSPLRRYADLINEAQILHVLETGSPRWDTDSMRAILSCLSQNLDASSQIQRFRQRYWKLVYIQQESKKAGDACIWDGVVTEENDTFISLAFPREQLFMRVKRAMFPTMPAIGQKVKARLGKIQPVLNEIQVLALEV